MSESDSDGLRRKMHVGFSRHMLNVLPTPYKGQDCSRLTLLYFVVGTHSLLETTPWEDENDDAAQFRQNLIDWIYTNQVLPVSCGNDTSNTSSDKIDGSSSSEVTPLAHCGFRGGPYFGSPWNPTSDAEIIRAWQERALLAQAPIRSQDTGRLSEEATRIQTLGALDADQSHLAMTYTALALLHMLGDDLSHVNKTAIAAAMRKLQLPDGSFCPVAGTENDMRFVYCAAVISHLMGEWSGIDCDAATRYIIGAQAYDGAVGQGVGQESHGGSTYCAVAALVLMGRLDELPRRDDLVRWCVMRQGAGFQGRINKPSDCCYSFWIGATLAMLGCHNLIEFELVRSHTLACQQKTGGFGKTPDAYPDVLHTYMALCGLSLGGEVAIAPIDAALGFRQDYAHACNSPANPYQVSEPPSRKGFVNNS